MTHRNLIADYKLETLAALKEWAREDVSVAASHGTLRIRMCEAMQHVADVVVLAAYADWSEDVYCAGWMHHGEWKVDGDSAMFAKFAGWFLDDELEGEP